MSSLRVLLSIVLIAILAACETSGPLPTPTPSPTPTPNPTPTPTPTPGSGISGTVSSPAGDVLGTIVVACFSEACDPSTDGQSNATQITTGGASGAYSVAVSAGNYAVIALQDTNGDQDFGAGDYIGAYPSAVTAPTSAIDLALQPYTPSAAARTGLTSHGLEAAESQLRQNR